MRYFPVCIDIDGKNILVVGGGKIAYRKTQTLLNYGAVIEIVTPKLEDDRFYKLIKEKKINLVSKNFSEEDIDNKFMVIAATDDKELNKKIYDLGNSKNILVNNITTKNDLNTRFTAIYSGDDFQISISTDKGNPTRSLEILKKIKKDL